MKNKYDILIVGGGPAGLSAALSISRMGRTALICDDGKPRNEPSSHLNNFPTQDGIHPREWRAKVRAELTKYEKVDFLNASVLEIARVKEGFEATLEGHKIQVRKVILADGIKDQLPELPGFRELWGKAIFHCPYCHGHEVKGQKLGLIYKSEMASHLLPLIYQLSTELVVFSDGYEIPLEVKKKLQEKNIPFYEKAIRALSYDNEMLNSVELIDGQSVTRNGLFLPPQVPFKLKSQLGSKLGCETNEFGVYKVFQRNETSVKGVFAAGDNMAMAHSVLFGAAAGSLAGAGAIFSLLEDEF